MNHYAIVCKSATSTQQGGNRKICLPHHSQPQKGYKKTTLGRPSSAEESESEESSGRVIVGKLDSRSIRAKLTISGTLLPDEGQTTLLATDTGISKTLLNRNDWEKVKSGCKFVKTSKRFRPYGTAYHLPIKGKAWMTLTAERGAKIETWVYVMDDKKEQSLLGESDAVRLGIVKLDLKGATDEIVNRVMYTPKDKPTFYNGETQKAIDKDMGDLIKDFPDVFSDKTGKFKGKPIKIQVNENAMPVIQPARRIPLQYTDRLEAELKRMIDEGIIEGPIAMEEPGTFLSNLVITEKKGTDRIRVTLDCQAVNKEIYPTHEPIPSSDELRHSLSGSDRFSTLDMTNCYYQFEIEECARKLYAFRTPWGIFRYTRMVMGTSPASSEVQKRIRDTIRNCKNAIHIKDDIMVHGVGNEHDMHLKKVLETLRKKGITLRPGKCHLAQPEVKWFGHIHSKQGKL